MEIKISKKQRKICSRKDMIIWRITAGKKWRENPINKKNLSYLMMKNKCNNFY